MTDPTRINNDKLDDDSAKNKDSHSERVPLDIRSEITLFELDANGKMTDNSSVFTIEGHGDSGGSALTYIATRNGRRGRLKEFYPSSNNQGFSRESSTLQLKPVNRDAFERELEAYKSPYFFLLKQSGADDNQINTFLSLGTMYQGKLSDGSSSSVYTWTEDLGNFKTFKEFIDCSIKNNIIDNAELYLFNVLNIIKSLCECVNQIHTIGYALIDIKPNNFGISYLNDKPLTEHIRIFDVNSLMPFDPTGESIIRASKGFFPKNESKITAAFDIYSIGATLYYALIHKEGEPQIFQKYFFKQLEEILKSSELISNISSTIKDSFIEGLLELFQKCLDTNPNKRYEECSELIEQLEKIICLLIPKRFDITADTSITDIQAELSDANETNISYALHKLEIDHPIYITKNETIRILTIGFGYIGQKFVDNCLIDGQISNKKLEIIAVTLDKDAIKQQYLQERPALSEYFEIDGEGDTSETSFGKISFVSPDELVGDKYEITDESTPNHIKELIKAVKKKYGIISYVFISAGNDSLSEKIARAVASKSYHTAYTAYKENNTIKFTSSVVVTKNANEDAYYPEIKRMALNNDTVFSETFKAGLAVPDKVAFDKNKARERSAYYFAYSIKAILYFKGVILNGFEYSDLCEAAKQFNDIVTDDDYAKLAYIEQKRWICERITSGWMPIRNENDYYEIGREKKHIALAKSRPDFVLDCNYMDGDLPKKECWDEPDEHDILLDDLDKASVTLHRYYLQKALEAKPNFDIQNAKNTILSAIEFYPQITVAFQNLLSCISKLIDGDITYSKMYNYYIATFYDKVEKCGLKEECKYEIKKHLNEIISHVEVFWNASRYINFKATSRTIVKSIPFILSNIIDSSVVIPLSVNNNDELFSNVAPVMLIKPKSVTFVSLYEKTTKKVTENAIKYIYKFFENRMQSTTFNFVFYYKDSESISLDPSNLRSILEEFNDSRFPTCQTFSFDKKKEIPKTFEDLGPFDLYYINPASSFYIDIIYENDCYTNKPAFALNITNKKIIPSEQCNWLNYINIQNKFFTVDDAIIGEDNCINSRNLSDEDRDYSDIIDYYKNDLVTWINLTDSLQQFILSSHTIGEFEMICNNVNFNLADDVISAQYTIPSEFFSIFEHIIKKLKSFGTILEDSKITDNGNGSVIITVISSEFNLKQFLGIICNMYSIRDVNQLSFASYCEKGEIIRTKCRIVLNKLIVENLCVSSIFTTPNIIDGSKKIIESLHEKKYITILNKQENSNKTAQTTSTSQTALQDEKITILFSSSQIKKLFTGEESIIELYIRHILRKNNIFDDIEHKLGITDKKGVTGIYFNLVATNGFTSLIIKFISEEDLKKPIINSFDDDVKKYGINAKAAIIVLHSPYKKIEPKTRKDLKECANTKPVSLLFEDELPLNEPDRIISLLLNEEYVPPENLGNG